MWRVGCNGSQAWGGGGGALHSKLNRHVPIVGQSRKDCLPSGAGRDAERERRASNQAWIDTPLPCGTISAKGVRHMSLITRSILIVFLVVTLASAASAQSAGRK